MKKLFTVLMLGIIAGCPACAHRHSIEGSGNIATQELAAIPFNELHTSRSVEALLTADGDRIRIEADDNLIDYVCVKQNGGTLEISVDPRVRFHDGTIRVTIPTDGRIAALKASSASKITCKTPLTGSEVYIKASGSAEIITAVTATDLCRIKASGSAKVYAGIHTEICLIKASSASQVNAGVRAETCSVEASSSSRITLSGEADTCIAKCSSSGRYSAREFIVKEYTASASSAGKADIHCTGCLEAKASSAGAIDYTGSCNAERNISSAGSITQY